jgi:hypothetical protein
MISSKKLQDLVATGFIAEEAAEYVEKCIQNKENIIVAGHKGHGILILLSNLLTCIDKANNKVMQIKNGSTDAADVADIYLVGDLKETNYDELLTNLYSRPDSSVFTLKDPDHNFSLMKIIRDVYNKTKDSSKIYVMVECKKINDEKKVFKVTRFTLTDEGKLVKNEAYKLAE